MTWDDVTYPEPREPSDDWRGGAGEEPDVGRRGPRALWPQAPRAATPTSLDHWARWMSGCACTGGSLVDPACGGCCEAIERRREETNGVPGAIPDREADDTPTLEQCQTCLNPLRDCKCPTTKGPRS